MKDLEGIWSQRGQRYLPYMELACLVREKAGLNPLLPANEDNDEESQAEEQGPTETALPALDGKFRQEETKAAILGAQLWKIVNYDPYSTTNPNSHFQR